MDTDTFPVAFALPPPDLGVSPRALAIARMVDRLDTGEYSLHIEKKNAAAGGGWYVELQQAVTVRRLEMDKP